MVPFNKPYLTGKELKYLEQAHQFGHLSGDGHFTKQCSNWLVDHLRCRHALLTQSCTAALEMSAILAEIEPGDEVIMPSYTFVSTANAFVLRGAIPVFVDIRNDTFNIDETLIEEAITPRTKAIVPVHYAGVACEMDTIMAIAKRHNLLVIEDNAQGIMSTYKGKALGSIGDLACLSFHETKNIISGEGGALLINNESLLQRAEIIREKGTNRSQFFRGQVDKYTWCDIGSSFLPSELTSSFLWAQMEKASWIMAQRLNLWRTYHDELENLEKEGKIIRPKVPNYCSHNAHMYEILMPSLEKRTAFISKLKEQGINAVFHYVPLHLSPFGKTHGRFVGSMPNTCCISDRLVRLPLWIGLDANIQRVINTIYKII